MRFFRRRQRKDDLLRPGDHDVEITHHDDDTTTTRGLSRYTGAELKLVLTPEDRGPGRHQLVDHVVSYVVQTGAVIRADETYLYGFWMLKFFGSVDGVLEVGEVVPGTADEFQPQASCAMRYWREQTLVCDHVGALHRPPSAGLTALVTPGLYEGVGVEGSRYGLGAGKSGWLLVADGWQGEATDLLAEHMYHLPVSRPGLVRYLGLPPGYRFHVNDDGVETDLEFDAEIR